MSQYGDGFDGATAVGEPQVSANRNNTLIGTSKGHRNGVSPPMMLSKDTEYGPGGGGGGGVGLGNGSGSGSAIDTLPFVDASNFFAQKRPLCIEIGKGGIKPALEALDAELRQMGLPALISNKRPHQVVGREVNPGSFGLYEYASQPQILLRPGKYPGFPLANWIGCDWKGTFNLTSNFPPLVESRTSRGLLEPDERLAQLGLTIVQVSQNQAAVCLDPQNRVFVVSDGGFVAMATSGQYKVLGLVDQTHLANPIKDPHSGQILGHMQSVTLPGGYVAATFLDIPANNVVILQRKDELFELGAGQHYLTTASVTIRHWYTKGEVQQEMEAHNIYTKDQVPVWLRMFLRYELREPLKLARHGYKTPFDSLQDKTRSILTQILAHLDYSAMARSRNAAPDAIEHPDDHEDLGTVFVSAVRTQATDELKVIAAEYGIKLEDLAIIDRKFQGDIARKMDELTTRALEAQVESANLDRENQNRRRKQEGDARVLELQNAMKRATANTDAENVIANSRARAEALTIEAQAKATAIKLTAHAEAEATRIKAEADAGIRDEFAQGIAARRLEVERTKAFGERTVFAPLEALNNGGISGFGFGGGGGGYGRGGQGSKSS